MNGNDRLRDKVAKAIADAIGHGMAEKCYTHADAAIAALLAQEGAAAPEGEGAHVFAPHWPEGLKPNDMYEVRCDDKGRNGGSWLRLVIANDCDVHLMMQDWEEIPEGEPNPLPSLRCRNGLGGGRNARTYQALLWLAKAMQLDAADRQPRTSRIAAAGEPTR